MNRLMLNSGQTCHAPTRMLVPFGEVETAKNIAKQVIASITLGDPRTDVYMGPVVSERQWKRIQSLIEKGIDEGATLLTGGTGHPDGLEAGYYVKPTVFADVTNDMTVAREEIFGPVLCIIGYKDVDDAVSIANDTVYGLAADLQSPPARSVRTMLLHGLKRAWSSSTVPPKIQKPLSAAIRCPATDANGAKSHSENSSKQRRSFTVRRLEPQMRPD